ncbi:hypothetical protein C815_01206 [Firmicutes bacterium M10-2]|nr:hypothetical protein C815_01206 [Firmicutes bacterium M10-2]
MEIVTQNATNLAWMGDALMTLAVRSHLLEQGYTKANVLQKKSAKINSAKGQSYILEQLEKENFFNEDETEILRRGRNATVHSKAKNADGRTYMRSTALEALIGYLYLYHHEERLEHLLHRILELGDTLQ